MNFGVRSAIATRRVCTEELQLIPDLICMGFKGRFLIGNYQGLLGNFKQRILILPVFSVVLKE